MRSVVIIGAGLAGLVAARRLQDQGWQVQVIDKGRHPGGRMATRQVGGAICDHGAQFLTVREPAFQALVDAWEQAGLVTRWSSGFPVLTARGLQPGDGYPRWKAVGGFRALGAALAQGIEVRCHASVTHLEAVAGRWRVGLVPGDVVRSRAEGPQESLEADAVICTLPGPQAADLLGANGIPVPDTVAHIAYHPCHAALMSWSSVTADLLLPPGGIRIEDPALPLGWMASQRQKGLISQGDVLVVHASSGWSAKSAEVDGALLLGPLREAARAVVHRVGGRWPGNPEYEVLHRWRYSLPIRCCPEPALALPTAAPLVLAGDGFGDRPRIEGAALSGLAAASILG